jgi:hypothetical protein
MDTRRMTPRGRRSTGSSGRSACESSYRIWPRRRKPGDDLSVPVECCAACSAGTTCSLFDRNRHSGKIWWNGALLLFVGAERKARIVETLCGNPSPGSLVEHLVQLFMTAGVEFASVGTRPRDTPATPCCGRSTFLSRCCRRATQFTILRRESNAYQPWRPPGVIASGRMRHTCFRASCSMR